MLHALCHVCVPIVSNNRSAAWDQVDEALECRLHRGEIGVNVRVVKLHVRQDKRVGKVVQKLWALVEERRVVFVALQQ